MSDLLTQLRTASAYRMATGITEAIVIAAGWQTKQAEALEQAIAEIERLNAEIKRMERERKDEARADCQGLPATP
jgi:transposase